jgi:hypothetical protein
MVAAMNAHRKIGPLTEKLRYVATRSSPGIPRNKCYGSAVLPALHGIHQSPEVKKAITLREYRVVDYETGGTPNTMPATLPEAVVKEDQGGDQSMVVVLELGVRPQRLIEFRQLSG